MTAMPIRSPHAMTRAAVEAAVRAELTATGVRLAAARRSASGELERVAALGEIATRAGLTHHEVAERAGISRRTLSKQAAVETERWPIELLVLLELGLDGARTTRELVAAIAEPPIDDHEVVAAVELLVSQHLIATAALVPDEPGRPGQRWHLTHDALDELPARLRRATMPPSQTWQVYIRSDEMSAHAIADAGAQAFGTNEVFVIPAGVGHAVITPEVAFDVEASDSDAAAATAVATFHELRERAGLDPDGPVIIAALWPKHPQPPA